MSIDKKSRKDNCPVCGTKGKIVSNFTVKHVLKKDMRDQIRDEDYHLCMDENCDVTYYNNDIDKTFVKSDLIKDIWFKKDADPKMACYCNRITEEDVIKTVVETNLSTMQDIIIHVKGKIQSNCKMLNPEGHCCTDAFNKMIKKANDIKKILIKYKDLKIDSKFIESKETVSCSDCSSSCCSDDESSCC